MRLELTQNLVPYTNIVGVQMSPGKAFAVGDICVIYPKWMDPKSLDPQVIEQVEIQSVNIDLDTCTVLRGQGGTSPKLFSGAYISLLSDTNLGGVTGDVAPHKHPLSDITDLNTIINGLDSESLILSGV